MLFRSAFGKLGKGFIGGLIAVAIMVAIVVYLCVRAKRNLKKEKGVRKSFAK